MEPETVKCQRGLITLTQGETKYHLGLWSQNITTVEV